MTKIETLQAALQEALGAKISHMKADLGRVTIECRAADYLEVMKTLRDHSKLQFEQLIDLCGMDYSEYREQAWEGFRFAAVSQMLSVALNHRLCIKVFAEDDEMPILDSVTGIYSGADWMEREAFDLYGILFNGHPDLRRILTDYGFVGHPFRKDFPISGYVEVIYDQEQERVVYQPVTIEPREVTPRIVREEQYGG